MEIQLDRDSGTPFYRQITAQVLRRIETGELRPGTHLPPERKLAAALGVNRTTVVAAYRDLVATGRVEARVGRGTWVSEADAEGANTAPPIAWPALLTPLTERLRDPVMGDLLATSGRAGAISFGAGTPALDHFPLDQLREAMGDALAERGAELFDYGAVPGWGPLRESLAAWTAASDRARFRPEQVVVLHGSQQGLDLLARVLLEPGDAVVVESPTYLGALQTFRGAGARLLPVPVDGDGLCLDRLEATLSRHRPKFIYTLPTFQNPTGATLSLARRHALLALAARHGVPVVEDDPYGALWYDAPPPPSLAALDAGGVVIALRTMSKVFLPGARLGWIVAPTPVVEAVTRVRQTSDVHPNGAMQHVLHTFLARGWLAAHVERMRPLYAARRDAMLAALAQHAPPGMTWTRPAGGYYLWCRLPGGVRARSLAVEAAREGVTFVAGDAFSPDGGERDAVRLNFTNADAATIDAGVRRLCAALRRVARAAPEPRAADAPRPVV